MNVSKLMFTYECWVGNNNVIKMKTIRKHQTIINPNVTPHRITPFPYIQNYYYYYTLYTFVYSFIFYAQSNCITVCLFYVLYTVYVFIALICLFPIEIDLIK